MNRRGATLALILSVAFVIAGGMSGIYTQEGHYSWEAQP